jgi:hypothetical protein
MMEEMYEEIREYAEGLETEEELYELIEDMEQRWRIRGIFWMAIDSVIDDFKDDFHLD